MQTKLEIQKLKISEIIPSSYNPRVDLQAHDPEYQKLKRSILEFGYVEPIVWNKCTRNLVGGHQRLKILIAEGVTEVEASIVDLPIEKEKALNLALNQIRGGGWDEEKLVAILDELSKLPDFDEVALTGFDKEEISEIFDKYQETPNDDYDAATDAESVEEPITKPGEIIQLGPHRIICGDSSKSETLEALFGSNRANLLHCDFPYNVNYGGGDRPNPNTRPKKSRDWKKIYSDNMPQKEYEAWMRKVFENIKNHLLPGSPAYVWQGHRQFPPMYQIMLDLGFHVSCVIVWFKEHASIAFSDYSWASEQCLYGWLEGAPHFWAGEPGSSNVWNVKRDPTKGYIHPTQKPIALPQMAIKNSSQRGDIVVDTFLGSGSTLYASHLLGRRFYGCELDGAYIDATIRKFAQLFPQDIPVDLKSRYAKEK